MKFDESQNNMEVIVEARRKCKTVHFASLMDLWSLNIKSTKAESYSEVTL